MAVFMLKTFKLSRHLLSLIKTLKASGIERFSFEYHKTKTKTKVITLANHKEHRQYSEPIQTRSNYM